MLLPFISQIPPQSRGLQVRFFQGICLKKPQTLARFLWPLGVLVGFVVGGYRSPSFAQSSPGLDGYPATAGAEVIPGDLVPLAQNVTVRIIDGDVAGSGFIVERRGSRYTVVTNAHVVSWGDNPRILTVDGQLHQPNQPPRLLPGFDLALLFFDSDRPYGIATLSPLPPAPGDPVYAVGFPLYVPGLATSTASQGRQPFRIAAGRITLTLPTPLPAGYSLGYSSAVVVGMSGGPVLNQQGQVVGINGRSADRDPSFGVYTLVNGQEPDPALLPAIMASSWGIPLAGQGALLGLSPLERGSDRSPWLGMPTPPIPSSPVPSQQLLRQDESSNAGLSNAGLSNSSPRHNQSSHLEGDLQPDS